MKKLFLVLTLLISSLILSGCTPTNKIAITSCQPGQVTLAGYGDPGQRLANCFVQYPGEPSRSDKNYHIVEDICGQFTPEFISNILGKKIIQAAEPKTAGLYNCSYYIDDENYVMLVLDYLPIENQKKGHESMGRKVIKDSKIPMENMVIYQEDGQINSIYLILSDNKFISIQRSSAINLSADELITFAANLANEIKDYQ